MGNSSFNLLTFPIWWYGEGLVLAWRHYASHIRVVLRSTGIMIFLRNLGQPLYGDYTRAGRIISFFIRLILLVFLIVWTAARLVVASVGFVLHLIILPLVIVMIIYQLFPQ